MKTGSLCSGYASLDIAVHAVLGGELAWVADNDPGAASILAHRFPSVPNLGDITATDWNSVEPVDVLTAGFPCQPVSAAGRRKGISDERWLFDDICAAVGRMVARPRLLVLENVAGLLSANGGDAMARVVSGLAALGYEFAYRLVRASDAGAPHRRERWFCVAWPAADTAGIGCEPARVSAGMGGEAGAHAPEVRQGEERLAAARRRADAADADGPARGQWRLAAPGQAEGRWTRADIGRRGGAPAADTGQSGRGAGERDVRSREPDASRCAPADTDSDGLAWSPERDSAAQRGQGRNEQRRVDPRGRVLDWGPYGPAIARWEHVTGRPAPRPTEPGRTGERLSPRFVEWMMGLPEGWVTGVPGLSRNAQLKALGNGVVPQQAELALRLLLDRAGFTEAGEAA